MKNPRNFFKCEVCGNLVGMVEDAGVKIFCCGEEMHLMIPNTQDASKEKHVPVATLKGSKLSVQVGSAEHPMTTIHHIAWIMVAQGTLTQRISLENAVVPKAEFTVTEGRDLTVYAYCNLHGLWIVDVECLYEFEEMVCSPEFPQGCQ